MLNTQQQTEAIAKEVTVQNLKDMFFGSNPHSFQEEYKEVD